MFFSIYKIKTFYKKLGFLKRNFKKCFKTYGSTVIKEIFKKQGILKQGNFRKTFKNIFYF